MIAAARFTPLGDLHAAVTVSPRQLDHISRRFVEVPPAQVLKRYRAIRAPILLGHPGLADGPRADMVRALFRSGAPDPRHPPLHRTHHNAVSCALTCARAARSGGAWRGRRPVAPPDSAAPGLRL